MLIFLLCILLLGAGIVIYTLLQKKTPILQEETTKRDIIVTEDNIDKIREELSRGVDDSVPASYDVMMNADWRFATGASESENAYVANYKTNQNMVYFDVILTQTEETVYSSPVLAVGAELKYFKLDKELPAGVYPAICRYYILDDNMKELCTVSVNVKLYIAENQHK